MSKLPLLLCAVGFSSQSFSQDSFGDALLDANETVVESVPIDSIKPLPADAVVKFEPGDAPFYARLRSYARILNRALRDERDAAIEAEARVLGLDIPEMQQLINQLQDYNRKEVEQSDSQLREMCVPVLRNELISSEFAREAIGLLDDNISIRNELAYTTIREISKDFTNDLEGVLVDRITETGDRLHFSRVDQVKQIDSMHRGDFVGVLTARCEAL